MINHVFIDFDETLFDHKKFAEWLDNYFVNKYKIKAGALLSTFDDYHDAQDSRGLLRLYRHNEHIRDVTGHEWNLEVDNIIKQVKKENVHFCYEDSHHFLQTVNMQNFARVGILTYGDIEYQLFKIGLCRVVSTMSAQVVDTHKGNYLREHFGGPTVEGVLVDDKVPQDLPESWQHYWLNRSLRQSPNSSGHTEVNSLEHASELLF